MHPAYVRTCLYYCTQITSKLQRWFSTERSDSWRRVLAFPLNNLRHALRDCFDFYNHEKRRPKEMKDISSMIKQINAEWYLPVFEPGFTSKAGVHSTWTTTIYKLRLAQPNSLLIIIRKRKHVVRAGFCACIWSIWEKTTTEGRHRQRLNTQYLIPRTGTF